MKAFHGSQEVKDKYLARVRKHAELDHLIRGTGWTGEKGCAVGCTLEAYNHKAYETELGIPEWLAHLEDAMFERMSEAKSRTWPEVFLQAIPVGADLEPVIVKFVTMVLDRALLRFDHAKYPDVKAGIDRVRRLLTNDGSRAELEKAADMARAADAAAQAARLAERAADIARAPSGAVDAAWAVVRTEEYNYFADELVKILGACE